MRRQVGPAYMHCRETSELVHDLAKVLTTGLLPDHLDAPALPAFLFLCCGLERAPTVALQLASTRLCVPEGSRTTAYPSVPAPHAEMVSGCTEHHGDHEDPSPSTFAPGFEATS